MSRRRLWLVAGVTVDRRDSRPGDSQPGQGVPGSPGQERRSSGSRCSTRRSAASCSSMLQPVALANCRARAIRRGQRRRLPDVRQPAGRRREPATRTASPATTSGAATSRARSHVPVHQYDCFNLTEPACPAARPCFMRNASATRPRRIDGRAFDTIENQFAKNGDGVEAHRAEDRRRRRGVGLAAGGARRGPAADRSAGGGVPLGDGQQSHGSGPGTLHPRSWSG